MSKDLIVPAGFVPRDYQLALYQAMDGVDGKPETKKKRALLRWHRRAGKDKACLAYMFKEMVRRTGIYYYFLPNYQQGRKIIWEGIDRDGFKLLHHMPQELVKRMNNQEMMFELTNGSIFRVIGTDNIDSIVGTNPVGCVFSEYSLQDPRAWVFISPILAENEGWAIFNGTPRGRNHMYKLENAVRNRQDWFTSALTVADTGLEARLLEKIDEDRDIHGEDYVQQEYYVAYSAGMKGAFYADQIEKARAQGRVGTYPPDDHRWVDTFWDLGVDDSTAVWFRQIDGSRIIWIDYMEETGKPISYYVERLKEKGYNYRTHYLPHDGGHRTIQTGVRTRDIFEQCLQSAGMSQDIVVCDRVPVQDGINAVRARFSRYYFNEGLTAEGVEALSLYHRRFDEKRQSFLKEPVHDWCSHCADALRTEGIAEIAIEELDKHRLKMRVISDYDVLG